MKIETHEVEIGNMTVMPEPQLQNVAAWIVTAIDLKTRTPVVFYRGKEKNHPRPFSTFDGAKGHAEYIAKLQPANVKTNRFAFVRIQKLEIV